MKQVPLFARCSRSELAQIAKLADQVDVSAGRVLAKEGSSASEFFVILEGIADVRLGTRLLQPLGPGDFLGEIALITDVARTATVTALTPMRVLVITRSSFKQLLRSSPEIQTKVLEATADRLATTLGN